MTRERTPEVRCRCGWIGVSLQHHVQRAARHQSEGYAIIFGGRVDCTPLAAQIEAAFANVRQVEALRGME